MNSRERMIKYLNGEDVDCIPIFPKISYATSRAIEGMTIKEYLSDPDNMSKAIIASAKKYGYDAVGITTDISNEGYALGSTYEREDNDISKLKKHLFESLDDCENFPTASPVDLPSTGTIILATKKTKEEVGDKLFVTAWCNGPLNVASQLLPIDIVLIGMLENQEKLHNFLQKCCDFSKKLARELVRNGADAVSFGHAMASSSMISSEHYAEFALPYEKQIVDVIHEEGAYAITHICGNIMPNIELINQNGSDIIDFDHVCDISILLQKSTKFLRGNIDPVMLVHRSKEDVLEATKNIIDLGKDSKRLILGTGCEVAQNSKEENLLAFMQAGRMYGKF